LAKEQDDPLLQSTKVKSTGLMYEFLYNWNSIKDTNKKTVINTDKRFIQMWLVLCLVCLEQVRVIGTSG
jgi:hypothetical protein